MPIEGSKTEAEKLCDEVMATISVAANLNLDRRVAVVVSRTIRREQVLEECVYLLGEEAHVSRNSCTIHQAHPDVYQGRAV
jgi:hypothetical protein